jgi:hypothetical protein
MLRASRAAIMGPAVPSNPLRSKARTAFAACSELKTRLYPLGSQHPAMAGDATATATSRHDAGL